MFRVRAVGLMCLFVHVQYSTLYAVFAFNVGSVAILRKKMQKRRRKKRKKKYNSRNAGSAGEGELPIIQW